MNFFEFLINFSIRNILNYFGSFQVVNILNIFLIGGDAILSQVGSYDDLCYEIVRNSSMVSSASAMVRPVLVGWNFSLINQSINRQCLPSSIGRLIDWLEELLMDWLNDWLIDWLIDCIWYLLSRVSATAQSSRPVCRPRPKSFLAPWRICAPLCSTSPQKLTPSPWNFRKWPWNGKRLVFSAPFYATVQFHQIPISSLYNSIFLILILLYLFLS